MRSATRSSFQGSRARAERGLSIGSTRQIARARRAAATAVLPRAQERHGLAPRNHVIHDERGALHHGMPGAQFALRAAALGGGCLDENVSRDSVSLGGDL